MEMLPRLKGIKCAAGLFFLFRGEVEMSRKLLLAAAMTALALVLAVPASPATAAQSDTVNITVIISHTIGVEITEGAYDFGTLSVGTTVVSGSSLTVTNTGTGPDETYLLSCSDTDDWLCGSTPGNDVFVLSAKFNSYAPGSFGAGDILGAAPIAADATHFAGDEIGSDVPYNEVRHLWLQLQTPTSTTSSAVQTIVLTITASIS